MDNFSEKSVVRKRFKNMVVLGLGLAVAIGLTPVKTSASLQNPAEQSCRFNAESQDSDNELTRIFSGERIIMSRGGNRSGSGGGGGGGGGMGKRGGGNSESGYKYGPGDGTGTGDRPGDGTGYGAKKGGGTGTGDRDGTGQVKGRGNQTISDLFE